MEVTAASREQVAFILGLYHKSKLYYKCVKKDDALMDLIYEKEAVNLRSLSTDEATRVINDLKLRVKWQRPGS